MSGQDRGLQDWEHESSIRRTRKGTKRVSPSISSVRSCDEGGWCGVADSIGRAFLVHLLVIRYSGTMMHLFQHKRPAFMLRFSFLLSLLSLGQSHLLFPIDVQSFCPQFSLILAVHVSSSPPSHCLSVGHFFPHTWPHLPFQPSLQSEIPF